MFQLFPSLHEQIPARGRELHRDTFFCVTSPKVQARISRAAVDSQKVKVSMKAREDGVFLVVFNKVGSSRS